MSDELFEDDPELTGPHAVTIEGQQTLAVRAMQRAASTMLAEREHAAEFRKVIREDLKEMRGKLEAAAAKLAQCPIHEASLEKIMTKLDGLTRKPTPSEELKAADARDDVLARRVKRWWPIGALILGALGIGGGGAAMLRERRPPDNAQATVNNQALIKAIQEEQHETRELLRAMSRIAAQKQLSPPTKAD